MSEGNIDGATPQPVLKLTVGLTGLLAGALAIEAFGYYPAGSMSAVAMGVLLVLQACAVWSLVQGLADVREVAL